MSNMPIKTRGSWWFVLIMFGVGCFVYWLYLPK
jgi:hypothetical protein